MNDPIPVEERVAALEEERERTLLLLDALLGRIIRLEKDMARRGDIYE